MSDFEIIGATVSTPINPNKFIPDSVGVDVNEKGEMVKDGQPIHNFTIGGTTVGQGFVKTPMVMLTNSPSSAEHAVNKKYVDGLIGDTIDAMEGKGNRVVLTNEQDNGLTISSVTKEQLEGFDERIADLENHSIGGEGAEGATVLYTKQSLTDEQKAQARENIGALGEELLIAGKAFTEEETIEGFVFKDTGTVIPTPAYRSTDFIPLPLGHVGDITVKSTINGNCALAFFDENETAILTINEDNIADYGYSTYPTSQERTFTVPDGAVYMRISAKTTSNPIEDELSFRIRIDISNLALEVGNISAALDGIIAIQNSLIGGAVV